MVRDMGVRKNIHIEDWASRRENLEHVFKYSKGNWARLAVWGVAVPFLFYKGICAEFHQKGQGTNTSYDAMGLKRKFWADGRKTEE